MDAIKGKFIEHTLREEGKRFIRNQGAAIKTELRNRTGNLLNNRKFKIIGSGAQAALHIDVPDYNRFLDIRSKFRRRRRGQSKRSSGTGLRIYNRFVMGHYHGIAERLMYGYTQSTIDMIREKWKGGFDGQ